MKYLPPTTEHLAAMKAARGFTGEQMAELFGLAGGQQWRKYTGGENPRTMSAQMLFFAAAREVLPPEQIATVLERMRAIGAEIDLRARS